MFFCEHKGSHIFPSSIIMTEKEWCDPAYLIWSRTKDERMCFLGRTKILFVLDSNFVNLSVMWATRKLGICIVLNFVLLVVCPNDLSMILNKALYNWPDFHISLGTCIQMKWLNRCSGTLKTGYSKNNPRCDYMGKDVHLHVYGFSGKAFTRFYFKAQFFQKKTDTVDCPTDCFIH